MIDFKTLAGELQHACNRELCRFLGRWTQKHTTINDTLVLQLSRPGCAAQACEAGDLSQRDFYIPWPRRTEVQPWFKCPPDLLEFYRYFDGLRDAPPGQSGFFCDASVPMRCSEAYPVSEVPELSDLADAPFVYWAANGDTIVFSQGEGFLWFTLETGIPSLAAKTFGSLLEIWVQHYSVGDGLWFDSHGGRR